MRGLSQLATFRLDLEWRTVVATALLIPMLLSLGAWQLRRADEKAVIGAQWEQRRQQAPVAVQSVFSANAEELQYLPVKVSGEILPDRFFLLDNRIHKGKFGYEVLAIVRLDEGDKVVLLNRGWVAGDPGRQILPDVESPRGRVMLTGHVYVPQGSPYLLSETALEKGWPKRIQALQMDKLRPVVEELAGGSLFPYSVRIDPGETGALSANWQLINVSPEKHTGYAVQWFAMALALFILFIVRSSNLWQILTRGTETNNEH